MVPGGSSNQAAGTLVGSKRQDAVQGSPLLIRAGLLQVFELQKNLAAAELGKSLRITAWGGENGFANPGIGLLYICQVNCGGFRGFILRRHKPVVIGD